MRPTVEERFWSKVNRDGPIHAQLGTRCWVWIASARQGWPCAQFWIAPKMRIASRVAWQLARGEIPDDLLVCHRCGNPRCVNPAHLFLGTHADNTADKMAEQRHAHRNKTHCLRGHRYDAANTMVNARGQRSCRACRAIKAPEYSRRYWRKYVSDVSSGARQKISRATGRPLGRHNAEKTHCKFGHPFDEANTRREKNGSRGCRACHRNRERERARRARNAA